MRSSFRASSPCALRGNWEISPNGGWEEISLNRGWEDRVPWQSVSEVSVSESPTQGPLDPLELWWESVEGEDLLKYCEICGVFYFKMCMCKAINYLPCRSVFLSLSSDWNRSRRP